MDATSVAAALQGIPPWLVILVISMIPIFELRGSLPVAIWIYHMGMPEAFALAFIGNMIPVPFILQIFDRVEAFLRRWPFWCRFFDRLFERTRRRASDTVARYREVGLIVFVGIPLPFTGAWTGSLIAYLFGLRFKASLWTIAVGVLMADIIVTVLIVALNTVI